MARIQQHREARSTVERALARSQKNLLRFSRWGICFFLSGQLLDIYISSLTDRLAAPPIPPYLTTYSCHVFYFCPFYFFQLHWFFSVRKGGLSSVVGCSAACFQRGASILEIWITAPSLNPQSIYRKHTNTCKYLHCDPPGGVHHYPAVPAGFLEDWGLKIVFYVNMVPKPCMSVREDARSRTTSITPSDIL